MSHSKCHPARYFASEGILTVDQACDAIRFQNERSDLYTYQRDLFVKAMAGRKFVFNSIDCIPFIDWIFESEFQNVPRIAAFIRVVCNHSVVGMARSFIRNSTNYRQAVVYYSDVISSLMISTLYGGSPIRVVRAHTLREGDPYPDPTYRLKRGRWIPATNYRDSMILNDVYTCAHRDAVFLNWHIIGEGYVALKPISSGNAYQLRARTRKNDDGDRVFIPALSYWGFCRQIVMSNILPFDLGRPFEYAHDRFLTEVRDSRNDRRSVFGFWSLHQLIKYAEESGEFTAFEILVVKVIFGMESGAFAEELVTSKRSWYRLKKNVETRFTEWARRIIED